jgi:hypothetical protein
VAELDDQGLLGERGGRELECRQSDGCDCGDKVSVHRDFLRDFFYEGAIRAQVLQTLPSFAPA